MLLAFRKAFAAFYYIVYTYFNDCGQAVSCLLINGCAKLSSEEKTESDDINKYSIYFVSLRNTVHTVVDGASD